MRGNREAVWIVLQILVFLLVLSHTNTQCPLPDGKWGTEL